MTTRGDLSWSGNPVKFVLGSPGQPDWWTVTVPSGFGLSVALVSLNEDYDLAVRSPNKQVFVSQSEDASSESVVILGPEPGVYDIYVQANPSRVTAGTVQGGQQYSLTPTLIASASDIKVKAGVADKDTPLRIMMKMPQDGALSVFLSNMHADYVFGVFRLVRGNCSPNCAAQDDCGLVLPDCANAVVLGTSTDHSRHVFEDFTPDYRILEAQEGMYALTIRSGEAYPDSDLTKPFSLHVSMLPRLCALLPQNLTDPTYPDLKNKPDNPDIFQLGVSIQPGEADLSQFSLMSFNAYLSPPYTDLFDFIWELDGKVVAGETGPTFLKPYADLAKVPMGLHTVKLTAKGAREYKDPTESQYNFTPFNGESRTVTCQFRGPA